MTRATEADREAWRVLIAAARAHVAAPTASTARRLKTAGRVAWRAVIPVRDTRGRDVFRALCLAVREGFADADLGALAAEADALMGDAPVEPEPRRAPYYLET